MTGKTAFPWHKNLPEAFPTAKIIVWLIKETMSETRTYDSSDKKGVKKRIQKGYRDTFSLEEPLEDEPSENESRDEKYRIPSERQWADCYDFRIDAPVYC